MPSKSPLSALESAFSRWSRKPEIEKAAAATSTKEAAALSLDTPEVCPYCKQQMQPTTAVGIAVWECEHDRHVAPAKNKSV